MLLVEFAERVDPTVNARAIALGNALRASPREGLRDIVTTVRSVAVYFDPLRIDFDRLLEEARAFAREAPSEASDDVPPIEVPVHYGGRHGPDLAAVARRAGCTEEEVVRRHSARPYRVYMVGFLPGFAYMGIVDPSIRMPRHAIPRVRVPAGAVGLAGAQTGIYPTDTPGGWQLIGWTPIKPFDSTRASPSLFTPGDHVVFKAVADGSTT